jgi:hypothetical protein
MGWGSYNCGRTCFLLKGTRKRDNDNSLKTGGLNYNY